VDVARVYLDVVQILQAKDVATDVSAMGLGDDPAKKEP
jgi:hypothetical protein